MAKEPVPGRVKTRLCPPLTPAEAAELYRAFLADVLAESGKAPEVTACCFIAAAGSSVPEIPNLPAACTWELQRGATLNHRMVHAFATMFERGFASVVMRNSDSPTLPAEIVQEAFDRLREERVDVVLGPDHGGGYYLVGLKTPTPQLILPVIMSVPQTMEQTLHQARALGLRVALLPQWLDVDDPRDLQQLVTDLVADDVARRCPRTTQWLSHRAVPGRDTFGLTR